MSLPTPEISNALGHLLEVQRLLRDADGTALRGAEPTLQQRLVRHCLAAGRSAVPLLVRALGGSAGAARLAAVALEELSSDAAALRPLRQRLEALAQAPSPDAAKRRAVELLARVAPPDADSHGARPSLDAARDTRSQVRALLDGISDETALSDTVDLIVEQIPEGETVPFADELLLHGGETGVRLVHALAQRAAWSPATRGKLREMVRVVLLSPDEREAERQLERGLQFLARHRPRAARAPLERFVEARPDDASGRSALGVCLLELGDETAAAEQLETATRLEPAEALHRWNLAAAAKRAQRFAGAYLALREYLSLLDREEGAAERRAEARRYLAAYEQSLAERKIDAASTSTWAPTSVARGEQQFAVAYAALMEGRVEDAADGFEEVLALAPSHHPSWGNLGLAYLLLDRRAEARRCLERALEIDPQYQPARRNLALLGR